MARVLETNKTAGRMKAVVDAKTDQILGAAILGVEGGEVMSVLHVAITGNLPYTVISDSMFAHTTLTESLKTFSPPILLCRFIKSILAYKTPIYKTLAMQFNHSKMFWKLQVLLERCSI